MLDMHVHVWPHEPGTPAPTLDLLEQYCEAADRAGVSRLAITEHSHRFSRIAEQVLPNWERPPAGALADATNHVLEVEGGADLDTYVDVLVQAKDAGLPVLVGLEVDYLPGALPAMQQVLADYPFDVLLGSVHWLDDWLFDAYGNAVFGAEWEHRDIDDVYENYVDSILDLASSGAADVLAHLDVIKVAGYHPPDRASHERRLIEGLASSDVVIELSSAGLKKPANELYPGAELLQGLVDEGFKLTTASDAHTSDRVGDRFDVLRARLTDLGVNELVSFDGRSRISVPLVGSVDGG